MTEQQGAVEDAEQQGAVEDAEQQGAVEDAEQQGAVEDAEQQGAVEDPEPQQGSGSLSKLRNEAAGWRYRIPRRRKRARRSSTGIVHCESTGDGGD